MAFLYTHHVFNLHIQHILYRKPWELYSVIVLIVSLSWNILPWSFWISVYFRCIVYQEVLEFFLKSCLCKIVKIFVKEPHAKIILLKNNFREKGVTSRFVLFVKWLKYILWKYSLLSLGIDLIWIVIDETLKIEIERFVTIY